jgi:protein SCO1/2
MFALAHQASAQSGALPPSLSGVGLEDKLGNTIPLNLTFQNEMGETVQLADYFDGETPVILNFVYHNCPMLCSVVLESFTETIKLIPWIPGEEFEVLTVSFSDVETPEMAAETKERILLKLGKPEASAGWHFLTGSQESIAALTESVGFKFKWVESTQEFAHPSVLIFLGGDGLITRYINGINYPSADVRRAIVEASAGEVGSPLDQVLLYCYRYDPDSNSYVLHATNLMKLGGLLTLILIGLGLFIFWRRERRRQNTSMSNS